MMRTDAPRPAMPMRRLPSNQAPTGRGSRIVSYESTLPLSVTLAFINISLIFIDECEGFGVTQVVQEPEFPRISLSNMWRKIWQTVGIGTVFLAPVAVQASTLLFHAEFDSRLVGASQYGERTVVYTDENGDVDNRFERLDLVDVFGTAFITDGMNVDSVRRGSLSIYETDDGKLLADCRFAGAQGGNYCRGDIRRSWIMSPLVMEPTALDLNYGDSVALYQMNIGLDPLGGSARTVFGDSTSRVTGLESGEDFWSTPGAARYSTWADDHLVRHTFAFSNVSLAPVPLPAGLVLLISGGLALVGCKRLQRTD